MNFLPATAGAGNIQAGTAQLPLWAVGRTGEVQLGIRPEDLYVAGHHPPARRVSEPVDATVDVTEPMGNEIVLYATVTGERVVARVEPQALPKPGETVRLTFDVDKLHLFDGAGESLAPAA